jgi:hypothetical protein
MGCTNSTKKQETEADGRKPNENGFKNLFYATTEFDISTSESENEDEILSIKSMNNHAQQKLPKKISEISSGLPPINTNSSTTTSALLDNRLSQTCL